MFIVRTQNYAFLVDSLKTIQVKFHLEPIQKIVTEENEHAVSSCYMLTVDNNLRTHWMLTELRFSYVLTR